MIVPAVAASHRADHAFWVRAAQGIHREVDAAYTSREGRSTQGVNSGYPNADALRCEELKTAADAGP